MSESLARTPRPAHRWYFRYWRCGTASYTSRYRYPAIDIQRCAGARLHITCVVDGARLCRRIVSGRIEGEGLRRTLNHRVDGGTVIVFDSHIRVADRACALDRVAAVPQLRAGRRG
jgi:hypothetical protein